MKDEDDNPREKEKAPIWMVSFADVTALTLTFFVLLFSMSTFKINEFIAVTSDITVSDSITPNVTPAPISERAIDKSREIKGLSLDYVYRLLESKIKALNLENEIFLTKKNDLIVITMSDEVLFYPDSFELSRDAQQALFDISSVLTPINNQVDILGHAQPASADINDITTWELSLLRALTVSKNLVDNGYSKSLSIIGSADGFFDDIDQSLTLEQRNLLSKRVDIIIRENISGQ